MEDGLKNGIKRLNIQYLILARKIGAASGSRGYAQTALSLDDDEINELMSLSVEEMEKVADVGVPLIRLKLHDLISVKNLYRKGNSNRAASLLAAGLVADCGKEGD